MNAKKKKTPNVLDTHGDRTAARTSLEAPAPVAGAKLGRPPKPNGSKVTALSVYLPPDLLEALTSERNARTAAAMKRGDVSGTYRPEENARFAIALLREVLRVPAPAKE